MAIAALFSVSMDELLSQEKLVRAAAEHAYESVTEYDVSRPSHFDVCAPGAREISVTVAEDEKLRVRLTSNVLRTLAQDYKVRLDEHRNHLDVDIRRVGESSEAAGKEALFIHISLPARYCEGLELAAAVDVLRLSGTAFPFELDGKAAKVFLQGVKGAVALNCNADMEIHADALPPALEVNQINAASVLRIPQDAKYFTKVKGKSNRIRYAAAGLPSAAPDDAGAESRVELAGMNAELLIDMGHAKNNP